MQMHQPGDEHPSYGVREYWTEALDALGATQMQHLKELMLSFPYFDRVPDPSLIASGQGERYECQVATRGQRYALIYTHTGRELSVAMGKIAGGEVAALWFDPRNGGQKQIGIFENAGVQVFDPPGQVEAGNDWVLILESMDK